MKPSGTKPACSPRSIAGCSALLFLLSIAYVVLLHVSHMPLEFGILSVWLNRLGLWLLTFFALLPLAMTMAFIWKTKETILDSVFDASESKLRLTTRL